MRCNANGRYTYNKKPKGYKATMSEEDKVALGKLMANYFAHLISPMTRDGATRNTSEKQ